jgi:hypothetical protein
MAQWSAAARQFKDLPTNPKNPCCMHARLKGSTINFRIRGILLSSIRPHASICGNSKFHDKSQSVSEGFL